MRDTRSGDLAFAGPAGSPGKRSYVRRENLKPEDDLGGLLSYPDPHAEAAGLLKIAERLGGIEAIRNLISIPPLESCFLNFFAVTGQLPASTVEKAIQFREQVLAYFDELVARGQKRQR